VPIVIRKKYFVLVADDSEEDSFFIERALRKSTQFQVVSSVRNGEEAIAYLSGQGQYADRQLWPLPHVLLMDLKMPVLGGFLVLEWLQRRSFPALKVVILSGSSVASDIRKVRALGADAFYAKPAHHTGLSQVVNDLERLLLASGPNGEVAIAAFQIPKNPPQPPLRDT
jgi:CheY-like chemotaxis protein